MYVHMGLFFLTCRPRGLLFDPREFIKSVSSLQNVICMYVQESDGGRGKRHTEEGNQSISSRGLSSDSSGACADYK